MPSLIHAYAATAVGAPLKSFEYDAGPLPPEQVEIAVEHCGICHSDLSMLDNEWRNTRYPLVPGHEVVGRVVAAGEHAKGIHIGDRVGLGWISGSCMHCRQCLGGDQHLCREKEETIVNRHGGFAERVRCHWSWALRLPEGLEATAAGPLFCGGITVFSPIADFGVKPLDRVGVVGIGGLGHMALMFLNAWGCEVTAFTSSEAKYAEAKNLGAHHAVSSTDKAGLKKLARSLDFILVTSNVSLEWGAYIGALAPHGRLHVVGAVMEPIPVSTFGLMGGQRSVSASPTG
ncbi:MAG: NAD(P)-dependent alcohol dehydrogenase, partial [Nevskiales bacterium]